MAGAPEAASPATSKEKFQSRAAQVIFILGLLALWYFSTNLGNINPLLLPKPQAVFLQLFDILRSGEFWPDFLVTLRELVIAFGISVIAGILTGFLVSLSPAFVRIFEPIIAGIYAVPIILFLPMYVLIFGLGPASKIALGATISFFPIALNTIAGFAGIERLYVISARSMGASHMMLMMHVLIPGAFPVILTGVRMGFTVALLSIIGSETIASLAGLGHQIVNLAEAMEMPRMFAYIVFVILIAVILNSSVSLLEKRGAGRR